SRLVAPPPNAADPRRGAEVASLGLPARSGDGGARPLLAARDPGRALLHRAHGAAPAPDDDGAAPPAAGRAVSADSLGFAAPASATRRRAREPPGSGAAGPPHAHMDARRRAALHRCPLGLASPARLRGSAQISRAARRRAPDLLRDRRA